MGKVIVSNPDLDDVLDTIVYVHGFCSSSKARKAVLVGEYVHDYEPDLSFKAIDLPDTPDAAYSAIDAFVKNLINEKHNIGLIGSSMGGFMSLYLSAKYGIRAVLINPCIYPWKFIPEHLGTIENPYTHVTFTLTKAHEEEARKIVADSCPIKQELLAVFLQRGDEVLDYHDSLSLLGGAALLHVENGGSHTFDHLDFYLPEIIRFLRGIKN